MHLLRLLTLTVALVVLSGCASPTEKLRIGMTREEVVSVMGRPDSAAAEGEYEFLNYLLPGSTSRALPSYRVRLRRGKVEAFGTFDQISRPNIVYPRPAAQSSPPATASRSVQAPEPSFQLIETEHGKRSGKFIRKDGNATTSTVRISNIEGKPSLSGTMIVVRVRVEYSWASSDPAELVVTYTRDRSTRFYSMQITPIEQGSGEIEAAMPTVQDSWLGRHWTFGAFVRKQGSKEILLQSVQPHFTPPAS